MTTLAPPPAAQSTPPAQLRLGEPAFPPTRLSLGQYHAMAEAGVLGPDDRVELLDGVLVDKTTKRPRHVIVCDRLVDRLKARFRDRFYTRQEAPLTLFNSEPEPDASAVHGSEADYLARHPLGRECRLAVEVADSSMPRDLFKARLYAEAGVEEYWIVAVDAGEILIHREPSAGGYRSIRAASEAETDLGGETFGVKMTDLLDGLP